MAQNKRTSKLLIAVTTMNVKTEIFHVDKFPVKDTMVARKLAMALRPNSRIHKVRFEWTKEFCK